MRHAVLITAYKNFEQLASLVDYFDGNFDLYIHIDRKSDFSAEQIRAISERPTVKYLVRKYRIHWGGFNHLKSILHLAEAAVKNETVSYVHLITGQDFPIVTRNRFLSFFAENAGRQFIEVFPLPTERWTDGGMDRLLYYNFYDQFDGRRHRQTMERILNFQKKYRVRRRFPRNFPPLYGGSTYWSLTRECLAYAVNYRRANPQVLKRFGFSFCAEEMYLHTVIMNSAFANQVFNDNMRFIDWTGRNGNMPSNLDETDYLSLKSSNKLFARKFEFPVSGKLLTLLKEEVSV